MPATSWLDRVTLPWAPRWTLRRIRARLATEYLARHYEAASAGRRTQGWRRSAGDGNAAVLSGLARLREQARDLVRNNPYAESALSTIVDDAVGWGLVATPAKSVPRREQVAGLWKEWAETTACDADGRLDFAGIQKQVMRTVVEAGEVLVRRRFRRPSDGLPIPLQLQVLEPDLLDHAKDGLTQTNADGALVSRIIQGVEFNSIGQRLAYWLFREHPGANLIGGRFGASERIPASEILHVFKVGRAGQVRAPSWFAPVLLRLKDFDDYEDAALMKQKIAACLAVLTTDVDGTAPPLGTADTAQTPQVDSLEPGIIANLAPGRTVTVVDPPTISEHEAYAKTVLRGIASGLGVTYEALTGDYTNLPFSAARMSRLRHQARIEDWRWRMLVPQFCDPVWQWAMQAAAIVSADVGVPWPSAQWTAPPLPMIEPDREGLAYQRNIRTGIQTLSEAIRERGYDPDDLLEEMAADWRKLDRLGLILDSDPRKMTQAGQLQGSAVPRVAETPTIEEDRLAVSRNGGGHG